MEKGNPIAARQDHLLHGRLTFQPFKAASHHHWPTTNSTQHSRCPVEHDLAVVTRTVGSLVTKRWAVGLLFAAHTSHRSVAMQSVTSAYAGLSCLSARPAIHDRKESSSCAIRTDHNPPEPDHLISFLQSAFHCSTATRQRPAQQPILSTSSVFGFLRSLLLLSSLTLSFCSSCRHLLSAAASFSDPYPHVTVKENASLLGRRPSSGLRPDRFRLQSPERV